MQYSCPHWACTWTIEAEDRDDRQEMESAELDIQEHEDTVHKQ